MRILVGTLASGENELDACRGALERQTHRDWEHVVLANLGKKAAIAALWRTFEARAGQFDLFVKLDADMVLADDRFFARCVERFAGSPELDELQVAVHDFFCDEPIMGLHVFRSTVRWPENDERLFTDATPVPRERRQDDWSELAPAARHCPDPSPMQAFHFGVHRALKVLQPDRRRSNRGQLRNHWRTLERTRAAARSSGDRRRALAVLGAEMVFAGRLTLADVDRDSGALRSLVTELEGEGTESLLARADALSAGRFGWLPSPWRREALAWWYGGQPLHPLALASLAMGVAELLLGRRGRDWERR